MWHRLISLLTLAALALPTWSVHAGEVRVAVATNFVAPLQRIEAAFKATSGHSLKVSAGATGKFYSQIVAGAPFEVLLAADEQTPRRLLAEGHAVPGSAFTYAIGALVLWSAKPGLVDEKGAVLASPHIGKIAIANPKVAPYGAAALQVLQALGLTERLKPKMVTGESIGQAFQFVSTGNADLGFVALSQVAAPGKPVAGSMWHVPATLHSEIRQDAVLLKAGQHNPAASAFMAYLRSPEARELIRSFGYGP
jgi:molybdate transport system substrate-binding protein